MPLGSLSALVLAAPVAFALGGCGSPEAASAASAASRFVRLAADDPAAACELLAPRTREKVTEEAKGSCAEGLRSQLASAATDGPDVEPEIAGHTAKVATGGQTVFLSLFEDGWKVLAAGCTRASEDTSTPYDCALEGD
ncbi:hypothetical protein [Intrasporangium sp. DVR]|uniref:hypothetical protein n=1 Tax=Intrasporangium sp. DVR TaxID=3127867 RepID=UPI00313A5935